MTQLCSIWHFNYMLTGIKKTGSVVDTVYVLKISAIDGFKFKCYLQINFDEDCV